MNIKEVKEWAAEPGREVFTSECEEIEWLIEQLENTTDICFDLGIELAALKGEPGPHHGT